MRTPDPDQVFPTVAAMVAARPSLPPGPVCVLLCESALHAAASARRLAGQGAGAIIVLGEPGELGTFGCPVLRITDRPAEPGLHAQLNLLIDALNGRWVLWLWNGEFFVFPFGEARRLADLAAFLGDERRPSLYTYLFDLYADELPSPDDSPEASELWFDVEGYHAFPEQDRQLRLFGGLGWRFQEFVPDAMRQIGQAQFFKAAAGVYLGADLVFQDLNYAAVSCPWHHSPTGAVMSLRRARRIMAHPNFPPMRDRLIWHGSRRFEWTSRQLLELGMIEPGQWF